MQQKPRWIKSSDWGIIDLEKKSRNTGGVFVIKKSVPLGKIVEAEKWLNRMAQKGNILSKVEGRNYFFKSGEPQDLHYFMLSPAVEANNGSWVFYEFLEKGGTRIPYSGISFLSPNLILAISDEKYRQDPQMYSYYFRHRDHRLLRRLAVIIANSLFMLACSILLICADSSLLFPLLFIAIGAFMIGSLNAAMLVQLCVSMRSAGLPIAWRKPKRPGC